MGNMRPAGHLGLTFTHGLMWSIAAVAAHPTWITAACYFGVYFIPRIAMSAIGGYGLKQRALFQKLPYVFCWDAFALLIWAVSFSATPSAGAAVLITSATAN